EHGALGERAPRLGDDAAILVLAPQAGLLEARVELDLVDGGGHARLVDDPAQMVGLEVRDADRPDEALGLQLDERLPRLDVAVPRRDRPVDEVEVDVVEAVTRAFDAGY